jgi:hypothetical protein
MVKSEKSKAEYWLTPMMNTWRSRTKTPKTAMATEAKATAVYPKTRLQEKQAMISEVTAMPGSSMT